MMKNKPLYFQLIGVLLLIVIAALLLHLFHFRIDLTADKRYSLSPQTVKLMKSIKDPIQVTVYLDGDLNPGFLRLKRSTADMLDEFAVYTDKITCQFIDPSKAGSSVEAQANCYDRLEKRGMHATTVYEKNSAGKSAQKILFPWAELISHNDTTLANLLTNIPGKSGDENLNASVEGLEYRLTDAIRRLNAQETVKIAFLEGNGELPEEEVYDATLYLSPYFQVDRGNVGADPAILNPYKVIIIAKPLKPFSEQSKFVIDQYIMNGGRVLWLVDGTQTNEATLSQNGQAAIMPLSINLDDQLFRYGIRINNDILQDVQCTQRPVNVAPAGDQPDFKPMPWFFEPLLIASPYNVATRNLGAVKAEFSSSLDVVGEDTTVKKEALLVTSNASHILAPPALIDLQQMPDPGDLNYFNAQRIPVAALLSGTFTSVFANRLPPEGAPATMQTVKKSKPTRMIVVADGNVIRNDVSSNDGVLQPLPLGYDRYVNRQYANREFIVNSVLYLADDEGWLSLRSREVKLRLLNSVATTTGKTVWQFANVATPLIVLVLFGVFFLIFRRRKFTRK